MATKRKRKVPAKSKRAFAKKAKAVKSSTKRATSKRTAKRASTPRKAKKAAKRSRKPTRKNVPEATSRLNRKLVESRSSSMSGDLQGLRDTERAGSESVSELLEEGNAFEAGIVAGVEEAEDNPESEIRSREVPEDDVPKEYLDED